MVLPLLIGLGTAAVGAYGANKAAKASAAAADTAAGVQKYTFDQTREDAMPWMNTGLAGMNALAYHMGIGEQPEGYDYQMTPGAEILMNQGVSNIEAGAAGRGGLFSGATASALEGMRADTVAMDRANQMNWLGQIAGMGQASTAGQAANAMSFGNSQADIALQRGNAQAAGYTGMANAASNGLSNWFAMDAYNKTLGQGAY